MADTSSSPHPDIEIILSTVADGPMYDGSETPLSQQYRRNINKFLAKHGFTGAWTRIFLTYNHDSTYTEVRRVTPDEYRDEIKCDALYTTEPDAILTLPVADCIATVVYDPVVNMVGLLHLGRHASVNGLIEAFAIEVADTLGSDPRDWYVWMSPSLKQDHDRLEYFDPPQPEEWREFMRKDSDGKIAIDTPGHNKARFERAGVRSENIVISEANTYIDPRFYSHRAFHETGDIAKQGRMIVAVMTK